MWPDETRIEDIEREIRVVQALCLPQPHRNIVAVLDHGQLERGFYYLDMELCDLSLDNYINKPPTPTMQNDVPHLMSGHIPARTKMSHIWDIMEDVSDGTAFIHAHGHAHRDLKPSNGSSSSFLWPQIKSSSVFATR